MRFGSGLKTKKNKQYDLSRDFAADFSEINK